MMAYKVSLLSKHVENLSVLAVLRFSLLRVSFAVGPYDQWQAAFRWLVDNNIDHYFEVALDHEVLDALTVLGKISGPYRAHVLLCLNDDQQAAIFKVFFPDLAHYEDMSSWPKSPFT